MSFFHNLNKTLDSIAARPEASQLNERDEGKPGKNFEKIAKAAGGGEKGNKIAGKIRADLAKAGKLEEETAYTPGAGYSPEMQARIKTATPQQLSQMAYELAGDPSQYKNEYRNLEAAQSELRGTTKYEESIGDMARKVGGAVKKVAGKALDKIGHGSDADMIRDLQRKMGVPQTGMKPGSEPNPKQIKEIGDTPAGLAAVQKVGRRADRAIGDAGTGYSGSELDNPDKTYAARDRANSIVNRERIRANDKNPTRVVGGPNHGDQMEEGGGPMTPKQKSFAKLAPPADKITFADKIAGAKKEVDEMLGDVAAEAMRNALGKRQQVADEGNAFTGKLKATPKGGKFKMGDKEYTDTSGVDESYDDEDDVYAFQDPSKKKTHKTATGGTVTRHGGVTRHQAAPGHYGGFDPETDLDKDDDKPGAPAGEKRGRGRPKGAPKGPERVTAKAYKHKGGRKMSEEEIQEAIASLEECGYSVTALEEESTTKKDNRAERAGKRVTKDIEYDEKKKDGIHGKKRGSEDSKAERAGKKVAKDIEYDDKKDKAKEDEPKKSKSKFKFGGSVYEALDAQLETLITEGMGVTINMNKDSEDGHPGNKSITVNADGEDAERLAELLKMAGVSQHSGDESCSSCGSSPCGCDMIDENDPNWPTEPTSQEDNINYYDTDGLNGRKSTGQSTVPVLASQLRRQVSMEESAKVEQNLLNLYRTFGK